MEEYDIISRKHWCKALADNFPWLTEEARMSPSELLEYYDYNELIHRREIPILDCTVELEGKHFAVFTLCKGEKEWIGNIPYSVQLDELLKTRRPRVRVNGGQMVKVVYGEKRDRKVEEFVPYTFSLVFRDL